MLGVTSRDIIFDVWYYHEIWLGWIGCALELQLCGDGFKPWLKQNDFFLLNSIVGMNGKGRETLAV